MDIMQKDLDEIKTGFSQMQTQQSTPVQPANPNVLLARVSTKESCAEAVTNVVVGDPSADSNQNVRKPEGRVDQSNVGVAKDPLGEIMKILYEVYMNPVELP
ncbi:hypothetical protein JHK85_032508 [Glycine max]|nr:hypothetical protein JHK85_032508 [Glycine max]